MAAIKTTFVCSLITTLFYLISVGTLMIDPVTLYGESIDKEIKSLSFTRFTIILFRMLSIYFLLLQLSVEPGLEVLLNLKLVTLFRNGLSEKAEIQS